MCRLIIVPLAAIILHSQLLDERVDLLLIQDIVSIVVEFVEKLDQLCSILVIVFFLKVVRDGTHCNFTVFIFAESFDHLRVIIFIEFLTLLLAVVGAPQRPTLLFANTALLDRVELFSIIPAAYLFVARVIFATVAIKVETVTVITTSRLNDRTSIVDDNYY